MKKIYLLFSVFLIMFTVRAQESFMYDGNRAVRLPGAAASGSTRGAHFLDDADGALQSESARTVSDVAAGYGAGLSVTAAGEQGNQGTGAVTAAPDKATRVLVGITYTNQFTVQYFDEPTTLSIVGFKLGMEKPFRLSSASTKANPPVTGFGLASTNYFGYQEYVSSAGGYSGSRHYLTGYLFRERDIRRIATLGWSAGAGAGYTKATADDENTIHPGASAGHVSVGGHLGLYAQKRLPVGEGLLLRLGYDLFIMTNSNVTGGVHVSFGF